MFKPSKYQQDIFDEIDKGLDHPDIFISAVAGAGKSTTILKAAERVKEPALFAAFNVAIADSLATKLRQNNVANVDVLNFHKIGNRVLARHLQGVRTQVNTRKLSTLAREWVFKRATIHGIWEKAERNELSYELSKLAGYCMKTLTDVTDKDAIQGVMHHYGLYLPVGITITQMALMEIMSDAETQAKAGQIDYDDMIYLPIKWNLMMPKYKWVFVDEAQDLSASQLELIMQCRDEGGRMVFVGDARQAIYGFAGADNMSVERILNRTKAIELPLNVCYRCASDVIRLAKTIVPAIEPREDAPTGIVNELPYNKLQETVKPNDMILCRLTAPLIELCIEFIQKSIRARVEGRDIGKDMVSLVKKVAELDGFEYKDFGVHAERYRLDVNTRMVRQNASDEQIQSFNDRLNAILVCVGAYKVNTLDELCTKIDDLFSDEHPVIRLSTIHRAKGLEAERVFIISPEKLPLIWKNQQDWQYKQEKNLEYVAYTRAMQELYLVYDNILETRSVFMDVPTESIDDREQQPVL